MSSPRLNVVSTTDATEDTEGQIITPVMAVVKKSYAYGENGFLEFGAGTDGALPFRVDDAGNVTAAGVTASTGPGAAAVAEASAYPLTITDVTAATLALAGQSITPAAGMAFRFEMWGTVTTTADTQTLNFGVYLGGIAGTAVNTTGVLKPNASATVRRRGDPGHRHDHVPVRDRGHHGDAGGPELLPGHRLPGHRDGERRRRAGAGARHHPVRGRGERDYQRRVLAADRLMATLNVDNSPGQVIYPPGFAVLVANTDEVNAVYISTSSAPSAADAQIPPLGSVSLDGSATWYARTVTGGVVVQLAILPGATQWTPSPAQVAEQLSALGLALNSTLETTNTTLGTPAQTDDVVTSLPANLLAGGVPPYVPNIATVGESQITPTDSPVSLKTFGSAGRLWYAAISLVAACSSTSPTASGIFAQLSIGSEILLSCQTAIAAASQVAQSDQNISFGGFPVAASDTVELNLNNGNSVTDVFIRASAVIYYSIP